MVRIYKIVGYDDAVPGCPDCAMLEDGIVPVRFVVAAGIIGTPR